jgi:hypothetical protein
LDATSRPLETTLLQARFDEQISPQLWRAAEHVDNARLEAGSARQKRLARLYDRADRAAIGSMDVRVLATATLAHWLYVRATAGRSYPWLKMASDYRNNLLFRAGVTSSDISALPFCSRPQIVRRAVVYAYKVSRE